MSSENTQTVNAQCPKCFTLCNEKEVDYESKHCKACRPKTPTERLAEEIEKFDNGVYRYHGDDLFAQALNSLSHGVGVHAVLDSALRRLSMQVNINSNLRAEKEILIEKLKKYETL